MEDVTLKTILDRLVRDFNNDSELVALNYELGHNAAIREWNRGSLGCTDQYMKELANLMGVKLVYEFGPHTFSGDDVELTLVYQTVRIAEV